MTVDINITEDGREFVFSAGNIHHNTRFGTEKGLWRAGKSIRAEFNKQVKAKDKTGRLYILRGPSGRKRKHTASAPGETPANRTGAYRKGFDFNVRTANELVLGNTVAYSGYLENGTKDEEGGTRMAARPGLGNAVDGSQRDIIRDIAGGIEDQI